MNFQSCFFWLFVSILLLSPYVIATNQNPTDRKCVAQCMEYCVNESESGIPTDLCNNACMTMCYSNRGNIGSIVSHWENDSEKDN